MSLQQDLVDALGAGIAAGAWPQNTAISVDEIASRHGVSRTVAREAVRALEARGMVRGRPRVGTVVQPAENWDLLDPDVIRWRSSTSSAVEQLDDLLDLRAAVEPVAAQLAASRSSEHEIEELSSSLAAMRAAFTQRDLAGFIEADYRFHQTLVLASGNRLFHQLWNTVQAALGERYRLEPSALTEHTEVALDRHERIVTALRASDSSAAALESSLLVQQTRAHLRETLGR